MYPCKSERGVLEEGRVLTYLQVDEVRPQDPGETFVGDPYTPSTKSLGDLQAIAIAELGMETHHRDRALWARVIGGSQRRQTVQTAIDDEHGMAERLVVHNIHPAIAANQLLPQDAIIAIKEPYSTLGPDGATVIKIDHPSDLMLVSRFDQRVPACWRASDAATAAECKEPGDAAAKRKSHLEALAHYSACINVCAADDVELERELHRKCAVINASYGSFEKAGHHALASVTPDASSENSRNTNKVAYLQAGKAAYARQDFAAAVKYFQAACDAVGDNKASGQDKPRAEVRMREQVEGVYDEGQMRAQLAKGEQHLRLDNASFTGRTEVRDTGDSARGRGLFATERIPAGELILREKAFAIAFDSDPNNEHGVQIGITTGQIRDPEQILLTQQVGKEVTHNQQHAAEFFALRGKGFAIGTPSAVDGVVAVDTFHVNSVLHTNAFHTPPTRSDDSGKAVGGGCGIWIQTSYVNHSCVNNSCRSYMGDMLTLRATKDIESGEEILLHYTFSDADFERTRADLSETWGFDCTCSNCTAETDPRGHPAARTALIREATAFYKEIMAAYKADAVNVVMLSSRSHTTTLQLFRVRNLDSASSHSDPGF